MNTVRLTERERLIDRILRIPDDQIPVVTEFIETLTSDPTWADQGVSVEELERRNRLDLAAIEAAKNEPTTPLEDVLRELGIS